MCAFYCSSVRGLILGSILIIKLICLAVMTTVCLQDLMRDGRRRVTIIIIYLFISLFIFFPLVSLK